MASRCLRARPGRASGRARGAPMAPGGGAPGPVRPLRSSSPQQLPLQPPGLASEPRTGGFIRDGPRGPRRPRGFMATHLCLAEPTPLPVPWRPRQAPSLPSRGGAVTDCHPWEQEACWPCRPCPEGGREGRACLQPSPCTPMQSHLAPRLQGSAFSGSQKLLLGAWQGVPTHSHCEPGPPHPPLQPDGLGPGDRPPSVGETSPRRGPHPGAGQVAHHGVPRERLRMPLGSRSAERWPGLPRASATALGSLRHTPPHLGGLWVAGAPGPGWGRGEPGRGPAGEGPTGRAPHWPSEGCSMGGPAVLSPGSQMVAAGGSTHAPSSPHGAAPSASYPKD